ncbi:SatD family protein [Streptococcus porcinus]|uniref:Secretion and acid tolerance protein SatD n=2 Tax=Streptococcus porcinus TaxID=1340 RepID=A0A4V0H3F9_STRPO|nr:SatD family protein [Streptococcus porcinus]EGJ26456.1 SatD protein [Streptococcus porcinus str. Jelinkova 176]SQG44170.1 secretion and acid tolerance protein SatD [Streptococcus porcinus]VTT43650.1 secretion and acid tolerance protein SatD [Streptococcus porcinus]VTT45040.1 secretion and acid tolerance protein SatD [Streptococcus porcinus]
MVYLALIGDIIQSKQLSQRSEAQERLKTCLKRLNELFKPYIISNFSLTLGDEFQGLMKIDAPIFYLIDLINDEMRDIPMRYGIGVGEILTDINPEISIGADGPAYWYAREAIKFIHQKNDYGTTQIAIRTGEIEEDVFLNSLLSAGEAIKYNWRASQLEVFHTLLISNIYQEYFDQQQLGKLLGLSPSALSKRLKSSNLKIYLRSRHSAQQYIQQRFGKEIDK